MKPFNWRLNEEEIHSYIIEAYENQGYECANFHDSGASVERGVDILLKKPKENIMIAVKIHPKTKDIKQLKDFIENGSTRKIYIYINTPTRPFFDKLKELQKTELLEVMGTKTLHEFLIKHKSFGYMKKYLYSHKIFDNLVGIMKEWYSVKDNKNSKASKEDIKLLWDWKDKSVSFYKTSKTIFDYMDPKIKSITSENERDYPSMVERVILFLDYMNHEVEELKSIFEKLKRTNSGLLSYLWVLAGGRSNWYTLISALEHKKDKETVREIFFRWFFKDFKGSVFLLIGTLENMMKMGYNLETVIDWLFRDMKN